jgi:hypothetical protein
MANVAASPARQGSPAVAADVRTLALKNPEPEVENLNMIRIL